MSSAPLVAEECYLWLKLIHKYVLVLAKADLMSTCICE